MTNSSFFPFKGDSEMELLKKIFTTFSTDIEHFSSDYLNSPEWYQLLYHLQKLNQNFLRLKVGSLEETGTLPNLVLIQELGSRMYVSNSRKETTDAHRYGSTT